MASADAPQLSPTAWPNACQDAVLSISGCAAARAESGSGVGTEMPCRARRLIATFIAAGAAVGFDAAGTGTATAAPDASACGCGAAGCE